MSTMKTQELYYNWRGSEQRHLLRLPVPMLEGEEEATHDPRRDQRSTLSATPSATRSGEPDIRLLITQLERDIHACRMGRLQAVVFLFLTAALYVVANTHPVANWHGHPAIIAPLCLIWMSMAHLLTASCLTQQATQRRIRGRLTILQRKVQEAPPREGIGVCLDAMRYGDTEAACRAQSLLTRMLPQAPIGSLTPAQHAALCQCLRGTNTALILAILTGFERFGISQSRRSIRRLLPCPVWLPDAPRIEQAARSCLAAIQEREHRQLVATTSLRAVGNTALLSNSLLRPADPIQSHSIQQMNRELLVRASLRTHEPEER